MKKLFVSILFLLASTAAYCGEISRIELTDGSVIKGEIIALADGIYTIQAQNIGKIAIDASKISKIETGNSRFSPGAENTGAGSETSDLTSQMNSVKTKIMGNPEVLKITTDLADDPQFQELMKDPKIVEAIKSGNMQYLMQNQKFMEMINNPKITEIKEKLGQ